MFGGRGLTREVKGHADEVIPWQKCRYINQLIVFADRSGLGTSFDIT
jgi:hypothetical protein